MLKTERLHYVLHLICAGVILFNAFSVSLLKLDLEMQRDFIAEVFCINKDKPEMSCHGQCFIDKELQKESKKQQESSETTHKEIVLSFAYNESYVIPEFFNLVEEASSSFVLKERFIPSDDASKVFRPPIV